ncbi:MAG: YggS family pyridoxal phosphate-dependent enzyme, partial [Bacteroidales bacterium]|nr:YggS family pyridoxal phosphate-dependent enzyme [Bacteroidales bacterium]
IIPYVTMIHSVDSLKLLREISRQAVRMNRTIDLLLQAHIAMEETKFGFNSDELNQLLADPLIISQPGIRICGLMGMATFTDDQNQVSKEFRSLYRLFLQLKSDIFKDSDYFSELSMGMSGDYELAIEEGSTLVRLGTIIFGSRN